MQGGDFVYVSAGAQKDAQQPKLSERGGKKGNFQLSKILPSPTKKNSIVNTKVTVENVEPVELQHEGDNEDALRNDELNQGQANEEKEDTEEETSDGDWYDIL